MTTNKKIKKREVRTTILTINRQAIDWGQFRQNSHIVRYDVRSKAWAESTSKYYGSMHNWYKRESDYPCHLHMHGPHLYVKYNNPNDVASLSYKGQSLHPEVIDLQNEVLLPQIMKLLVADFFRMDARFVSNADFFLWADDDKDWVTGLRIKLEHNWQGMRLNRGQNDEFRISDEAARLKKLRDLDFKDIDDSKRNHKVYYGRFYMNGMAVFKQLKPNQLTLDQFKEGIYELYKGSSSNRASLTFHSVMNLDDLRQTRSYLLNQFIAKFVTYLNKRGLPFQQKSLPMQSVHTTSTIKMKQRQLPSEHFPIYIVDDRINAIRNSDNFVTDFCKVANEATDDHDTLFIVRAEADLQPGDHILRIQDYEGDEFDPEKGILKNWRDTKADFYARHPTVVKHTLNINHNSKKKQEDAKLRKPSMSADKYLNYPVPKAKAVKTQLNVIRNQLVLKDVIMFPEDVCPRLPQVAKMGEIIFLYKQALIYFDGSNLHFMSIANNLEDASVFVQTHTGWDLLTDVLMPSVQKKNYQGIPNSEDIEEATKRPFIISRDFVWEIWEDKNGRALHEDIILQKRFETLEESVATKQYYPTQPIKDTPPFTVQQLQNYARFLDQHVRQPTISYLDLKKQYGNHIKDERGHMIVKDGGFYHLLDIKNETKFKHYLNKHLGFSLESIREDHLFPIYQGIWYAPDTNHYVAGVKDSNQGKQERGHTLRRIVVHQGEQESAKLQKQLKQSFFPLMEVNFIRHHNYTVVPFPFRLIEMWQEITNLSADSSKPSLTKTAYLAYTHCPKRFWLEQRHPHLASPPDSAIQRRRRIGQKVDDLAQEQFPNGRLIPQNVHPKEMMQLTTQSITDGTETLFQATFAVDDLHVRTDILTKTMNGWRLIEVKSNSSVKPEHLSDLAFQTHVLGQVGIDVTETAVFHLNSDCRHPDLTNLFTLTNVTADTQPLLAQIPNDINLMRQALLAPQPPNISISRHCTKPHPCPFYDHCWKDVDGLTIYDIPRLSAKREQPLQNADILYLTDIPSNYLLTSTQRAFVDFIVQEKIKIDRAAIQQQLGKLIYPLYFFDFETIDYAIPQFNGCKPYQQVPFQYSCHILKADGKLTHREYLHSEADDPRRSLINALLEDIGDVGSIIVYHAPFERKRLQELAEAFPEHAPRLSNMMDRLWDQLNIFKKHYRDYRFGKSNSLKAVLPVIAPSLSYKLLDVQDGTQAQVVWEKMIGEGETAVKQQLVDQLLAYCHLDTLAMVEIHYVLIVLMAG